LDNIDTLPKHGLLIEVSIEMQILISLAQPYPAAL